MIRIAKLWLAVLVLTACSGEREHAVVEAEMDREQPVTIDWIDGSVEEAFAAAEREGKPLFLYWGAEWCPPCHELKATIFQRPEFIRQSRQFIMVYLDGDSERAQQYAERFSVMGYPTVIIFDAAGTELTRIPGGMNIQQYVGVLDLALNAMRPVATLLEDLGQGKSLSAADWKLLAYYSWWQDRGHALGDESLQQVAPLLAASCPAELAVEKSLLQMLAVQAWLVDAERDEDQAAQHRATVDRVLADVRLAQENLGSFMMAGDSMVEYLSMGDENALAAAIQNLLRGVIDDPRMPVLTRIDALQGWVAVSLAASAPDAGLAPESQAWLRQQLTAVRSTLDSYQLHAGLNGIWQAYYHAGMPGQARASLEEGIRLSDQPYYFMADLAYFETQLGNGESAMSWYQQAWQAAEGPATRQQWGVNYLEALVTFAPEDAAAISGTARLLLEELSGQRDAIHQRTARELREMSRLLLTWAGEAPQEAVRQQALVPLREQMRDICEPLETRPDVCDSFLVAVAAPGDNAT